MEQSHIRTTKKTLKDGTVKIYTYDYRKYNNKYYDKIKQKEICSLCNGSYIPRYMYKHTSTLKHILATQQRPEDVPDQEFETDFHFVESN
jgi:hypothetical protein